MGKWAAKLNKVYNLRSNGRSKFADKDGTSTSKLYAVVAVLVFFTKIGSMFLVGKDLRGVENRGKERIFKTWEKWRQPIANKQVRVVRSGGFGRRFGRNGLGSVEVSV